MVDPATLERRVRRLQFQVIALAVIAIAMGAVNYKLALHDNPRELVFTNGPASTRIDALGITVRDSKHSLRLSTTQVSLGTDPSHSMTTTLRPGGITLKAEETFLTLEAHDKRAAIRSHIKGGQGYSLDTSPDAGSFLRLHTADSTIDLRTNSDVGAGLSMNLPGRRSVMLPERESPR